MSEFEISITGKPVESAPWLHLWQDLHPLLFAESANVSSVEKSHSYAEAAENAQRTVCKKLPVVDLDSAGHVKSVARPDGSHDSFDYDGDKLKRYTRVLADGNVSIWEPKTPAPASAASLDSGLVRWTSVEAPDNMLINLHVEKSGNVIFEEITGSVINKHTDGSTLRDNVNGSRVMIDADSRIKYIEKPDGTRIDATYISGEPVKYTVKLGSKQSEWTRSANNEWTSPGIADLRRHYKLSETGIETYVNSNQGNVTHIEYPDGSNRSFSFAKGRLNKVVEHSLQQHKDTSWTRAGNSDMWKSAGLAEKRMAVTATSDGDYSFIDKEGIKHTFKLDESERLSLPGKEQPSAQLRSAMEKLAETARSTILDPERRRNFDSDLNEFAEQAQVRGLADKIIVSSLQELNALLSPKQSTFLSNGDRVKLSEQILHNLANPRTTDQGSHNTCGATAAEVVLSAKFPDRLVNVLRQIADTGQYHTAKGLQIKPSAQSLAADSEAKSFDPYDSKSEGVRSFAGQLIQTVGIDCIYAGQNLDQYYEAKDRQEYVVDRKNGKTTSFDGLEDPDVQEMLRQISGVDQEVYSKDKQFNSAASLQEVLQKLESTHSFPIVFSVDLLQKGGPFFDQYREDRAGLDDAGHYITIWDIDSGNNVMVDDQFGRDCDFESLRRVPVENMFQTSMGLQAVPVPHEPFKIPLLPRTPR